MLKNVQLVLGMAMQVVKSNLTQSKLKSQKILKSNSLSKSSSQKLANVIFVPRFEQSEKEKSGFIVQQFFAILWLLMVCDY